MSDTAHGYQSIPGCPSRADQSSPMSMHFSIPKHPKETLEVMNSLRLSGHLCDIALRAESETFSAHKVVLSAVSPYFNAMFCRVGMRECTMMEIPLQGVRACILKMIMEFAYTSEINISESNVCSLLPVATMFQMSHIVDACCTFLQHQLDPSNCIGIADFAHAHGCHSLYNHARNYIYKHFSEVSKCEEFLQLSHSQVIQVIKRDELYVKCESEVYEAVMRWVKHDEEKRCARLANLLSAVRCCFLKPCFLESQLNACQLIRRRPECIDYLSRIFQDLRMHKRCTEKHRRLLSTPPVIYIIGGYLRHSLNNVDCWNPESQQWYRLADLPTPRSGIVACQLQGRIYVIGGRNNSPEGNDDSPSVDCYNPDNNTWTKCADMLEKRNRLGVGAIDELIYAVGGSHGTTHHSSVERYDPNNDRWSCVSQMSSARLGVSVAVVDRLLYAVGGFDGTNRLSSVECYHPEKNEWSFVAPLNVERSGAGICSLDQYIYVVGGYDSNVQLCSAEKYNTETNQWQIIQPMRYQRSALSLAVVSGKLYALGGYDGVNFSSIIECYDPESDEWTDISRMTCGRSGHGIAVGTEPNSCYATICMNS